MAPYPHQESVMTGSSIEVSPFASLVTDETPTQSSLAHHLNLASINQRMLPELQPLDAFAAN